VRERIQRGYGDQREYDRKRLTYTTAPLTSDLEVTGHPIVHLFMDANAPDGAVFAYLEDVLPNGEVRYVTEGELRLIHRSETKSPIAGDPIPFHSYRRADSRAMAAGDVSEVTFDLLPTSFLFRAGHAVRLAIAGADAASFDAPLPHSMPLVYSLYRGGHKSSRLDLPMAARRIEKAR
jgi:putative CocE/NonD family hydrolase